MTNTLKDAAKRVAFAAMKPAQVKEHRSERFAKVVVDEGYVTFATNGHRLAYCRFGSEKTNELKFQVDPKTGLIVDAEPLLSHQFCDWKRILPPTREAIAFDRKALLEALAALEDGAKNLKEARKDAAKDAATKAAATLNIVSKAKANESLKEAKERANQDIHAAATFDADGVHFQLDIRTNDEAELNVKRFVTASEVPIRELDGLHIGLNIKYLREAIQATRGTIVLWSLNQTESAFRAFEISAKGDNLTNVIMPVRFRHLELDAPVVVSPAKKSTKSFAKPAKRTAKTVAKPSPTPTPETTPAPAKTAEAVSGENELVKVQSRRGERHWRPLEVQAFVFERVPQPTHYATPRPARVAPKPFLTGNPELCSCLEG